MSAGLSACAPLLERVRTEANPAACQFESIASQQIRGLVQRLFLPGWPRPAHQVVFSAADEYSDAVQLCIHSAELLARESNLKVCLVEGNISQPTLEQSFGGTGSGGAASGPAPETMRKSSRQIQNNLWFVPRDAFFRDPENAISLPWLRCRLGELRREFDYGLIHGSPADKSASLLAHLADGLVLTVDAERTRRVTALRVRNQLVASNVRLLGAVLLDRRFPIPERLYRRL